MAGLSELVRGYQEAQQQKERRARTVADAASESWERDYKLNQAKAQASYQGQELLLRQNEQNRLKDKQEQDDSRKKQDEVGRNFRSELLASVKTRGQDLFTERGREAIVQRALPMFMKVYPSIEDAVAAARSIVNTHASEYTAPLPGEAAADGAQSGGQDFTSRLSGLLHGQGQPATQGQRPGLPPQQEGANPIFQHLQGQIAKTEKQIESDRIVDEKHRAEIKRIELLTKADEALKEAMVDLDKAHAKKVREDGARAAKMEKYVREKEIADIAHSKALTSQTLEQIRINQNKDRRDAINLEAEHKPGQMDPKLRKELRTQLDKDSKDRIDIGKHIAEVRHKMAELDSRIKDPANAADRQGMESLKIGYGEQLSELLDTKTEVEARYQASKKAALENGVIQITAPSAAPAPRENRSAIHAATGAMTGATRGLRSRFDVPPGAPHPPGAQPGLYARPAPKAKKKSSADPLGIR